MALSINPLPLHFCMLRAAAVALQSLIPQSWCANAVHHLFCWHARLICTPCHRHSRWCWKRSTLHSTEHDPSAVSVQCLSCAQQSCQSYEACSSERTSPAAVDEQLRHVIVGGAGPCEVGSSCQPLQGFGASLAENVLLVLVVQHGMLGVMHKQRVEVVVRTGCG